MKSSGKADSKIVIGFSFRARLEGEIKVFHDPSAGQQMNVKKFENIPT